MSKLFLSIIVMMLVAFEAMGTTRYSFPGNGFASLKQGFYNQNNVDTITSDKALVIGNNSSQDYILQDTTLLPHNYMLSAKLANLNNTQRRNSSKGGSTWGLAFDIQPNGNKYIIELKSGNPDTYNDISSNQQVVMNLIECNNGATRVIGTTILDKSINLYNGHNILTVNVVDNTVTVSMGRKNIKKVLEKQIERNVENVHAGIFVGKGSKVSIERTLVSFQEDLRLIVNTGWTMQKLNEHFTQSVDPVEGYWDYLDRDMEDKVLKMGGRYRIALVKNKEDGYDIIYISGAQVNKSHWEPGGLKGKLTKTIFSNTYKAMWVDSMYLPFKDDVQATIENGVILSIKLPVLKSQLRFSKVIE